MLRQINCESRENTTLPQPSMHPDRWDRCEKEDMKEAIDALYEFKKKLMKLHPNCVELMNNMLQQARY